MRHATNVLAWLLALLAKFPGHLAELVIGGYVLGWGVTMLLSPTAFEVLPSAYLELRNPRGVVNLDEWHYGLTFLAAGLVAVVGGFRVRWHRSRLVGMFLCFLLLHGLSGAFGRVNATSAWYTYGYWSVVAGLLFLRLVLLREARARGLIVEPAGFRAFVSMPHGEGGPRSGLLGRWAKRRLHATRRRNERQ